MPLILMGEYPFGGTGSCESGIEVVNSDQLPHAINIWGCRRRDTPVRAMLQSSMADVRCRR